MAGGAQELAWQPYQANAGTGGFVRSGRVPVAETRNRAGQGGRPHGPRSRSVYLGVKMSRTTNPSALAVTATSLQAGTFR
jgi:hypothetical protein